MELIFRHAWVLMIAVTCANAAIWRARSGQFIIQRPELAASYPILIRGFLIWGNLPWVVLGFGCIFGGLDALDFTSRANVGNAYVLAFLASFVFVWVRAVQWVFFRGGAEALASHPGLLRTTSPTLVKLWVGACLLGGVAGMVGIFLFPT